MQEGQILRLCDYLAERQEDILAHWERAVRDATGERELTAPVLRDHVPDLLGRLASIVRSVHEPQAAGLGDLPDRHALHRLEVGFDLRDAVRELALLRAVVLRLWEPHAVGRDAGSVAKETRRFAEAVDDLIARSVERYTRTRERTLASLDRVSAAALGTGDLETFLPRLLQVLLETTEAADTALIYLAEEDGFRVRAAAGLGAEAARGFRLRRGEGLLGRVTEAGEPLLVRDAGRDPLVRTPGLAGGAIQALYAVPLLHDSGVIGAAFMGSANAYDFSDDDKLVLRALAQRATSIIVQAQLVAREREALAALRLGEGELRRILEISPDMLAVIGADGSLRRVNPAFAHALGASEEELLARPYDELVLPDDRERVREELQQVLGGRPAHRFDFRMLRKDGAVRWVSFHAAAEPNGSVFVAVGRDVTDERERSEFEQQLIGIVSHDLRNPLSTIHTSAAVLVRRADELDERTVKAVARIHSAAERAAELIRDLLDFTRARTAGGIPIVPQPLDLHEQVRRVAEDVHAAYPERSLELEHRGDGDGSWDPARIRQVVENLVSNAFKYGTADAPVVVRTLGGDRWIRLEVHNEGPPIEPALLPHVFEPLRQGRRTGGVGGVRGVGLGLYIVDHIARAHGGGVEVHSTATEGTTFIVRLPREPPQTVGA
jgi:PAS domain S-box-containing protein